TSPLLLLAVYFRATPQRPGRLRRLFARIHYIPVFVAIGVTMHLLTWLLMDVGTFTWVALAYYPAIARPTTIPRFITRLTNRASPHEKHVCGPSR
ncbi:MAG TPA: hypothetical protein P5572_15485, partial [Phycisphaerae bacterium]|nr:hypothetical protein [Phycisphaerae bacterium]